MIATEINWSRFYNRLNAIVSSEINETVENVYITGSLATGDANQGSSDIDIIVCFDMDSYEARSLQPDVRNIVEEKENDLLSTIDPNFTGVHLLGTENLDRGSHRAMELQHQGNELARTHGGDVSDMQIYNMKADKIQKSA